MDQSNSCLESRTFPQIRFEYSGCSHKDVRAAYRCLRTLHEFAGLNRRFSRAKVSAHVLAGASLALHVRAIFEEAELYARYSPVHRD